MRFFRRPDVENYCICTRGLEKSFSPQMGFVCVLYIIISICVHSHSSYRYKKYIFYICKFRFFFVLSTANDIFFIFFPLLFSRSAEKYAAEGNENERVFCRDSMSYTRVITTYASASRTSRKRSVIRLFFFSVSIETGGAPTIHR